MILIVSCIKHIDDEVEKQESLVRSSQSMRKWISFDYFSFTIDALINRRARTKRGVAAR